MNILMIPVWILLGLIALIFGLVVLLVILAAVPIRYHVHSQNTDFRLRISWLFRMVCFAYERQNGIQKTDFRILFFRIDTGKFTDSMAKTEDTPERESVPAQADTSSQNEKNAAPKKATAEKNLRKKPVKSHNPLTDLRIKPIIKPVAVAVKKILGQIFPTYIKISGKFGLVCPYQTGLVFGTLETLTGVFGIRDNIHLTGDFNTDVNVFDIQAEVRGRILPIKMMFALIGLILKKPVRDFVKGAIL